MNLPAVPDSFRWTIEWWGPALRCRPLEPLAPHLFTTRLDLGGVVAERPSPQYWEQVARAVGAPAVQTLTQVHGRGVLVVREAAAVSERPEADAVISNTLHVAVAVRAADCVPLLLADPKTGAVAAVHAGWRGTAAGVATAAVEALEREFGSDPADLVAAIGPSIGPCCYEVGTELVDAFAAAGHARHLVDRWFDAPPPRRGEYRKPTLHLDTWAANRDQLMLAGVREQNIHSSGLCTADNLALFPSYRAEREKAGRLAGVIRARG